MSVYHIIHCNVLNLLLEFDAELHWEMSKNAEAILGHRDDVLNHTLHAHRNRHMYTKLVVSFLHEIIYHVSCVYRWVLYFS